MTVTLHKTIAIRAIEIQPYKHAILCTIGDDPRVIANDFVTKRWSEDGKRISFMLDTHNFDSFEPDELVEVVETLRACPAYKDLSAEEFLALRPITEVRNGVYFRKVGTDEVKVSLIPDHKWYSVRPQGGLALHPDIVEAARLFAEDMSK